MDYREVLKNNICEVVFTKKNGDERTMTCTLHPDVLPITEGVREYREPNPDTISVWDIEADGWRAFRLDSIKSFEIVTE